MRHVFLQAKFDEIIDRFDENDDVGTEDINLEMHDYWLHFLEAGFNVGQIVKMLSPQDVWENYDTLVSYGAEIDFTKFLTPDYFDTDFVEDNWQELIERGVTADDLVTYCQYDDVWDAYDVEGLFEKGVSLETALKLSHGAIECHLEDYPLKAAEIFIALSKRGLETDIVKQYLKDHLNGLVLDSIVWEDTSYWEEVGIYPHSYEDDWMEYFGRDYLYRINELPKAINVNRLIRDFSLKEILDVTEWPFYDFINDFIKADGDIEKLKEKFLNPYPKESNEIEALLDFLLCEPEIFNVEDLIEHVDFSKLDQEAKEFYLDSKIDKRIIALLEKAL